MPAVQTVRLASFILLQIVEPTLSVEVKGFPLSVDIDHWDRGPIFPEVCLGLVEQADDPVAVEIVVRVVLGAADFPQVFRLVSHEN